MGLEQNIVDTAINEWRKRLRAWADISNTPNIFTVGSLKNGILDELSATVTERNMDKMSLCVILIK